MSINLNSIVAGNIRAESARRRLTMSDVADRSGLSRATVSRGFQGNGVTLETLSRIAMAIGVTVADLLVEPDARAA